jgi:hypothetical protein
MRRAIGLAVMVLAGAAGVRRARRRRRRSRLLDAVRRAVPK